MSAGSGSGSFSFPTIKEYVSEIIQYREDYNITAAIPTVNILSSGKSYGIFLSNDDGVTWENATNETEHVFSTTGKKLRIRVVGEPGFQFGPTLGSDNRTYLPGIRVNFTKEPV